MTSGMYEFASSITAQFTSGCSSVSDRFNSLMQGFSPSQAASYAASPCSTPMMASKASAEQIS